MDATRLVLIIGLTVISSLVAQERFADHPFLNSQQADATSLHNRFVKSLQLGAGAGAARVSRSLPLPSRMGSRTYRRFHANDSLVGRNIPCTRDEKICFHFNLMFDPQTDKCQPMGGGGCDLAPNRQVFLNGSGRIFGTCRVYQDPCPGYRMAYDGRCYPKEMVRDICGCNAEPTSHILGGFECRCAPSIPRRVNQPRRDGVCRIPDLRFPDVNRQSFYNDPRGGFVFNMTCSEKQSKCFSQQKLWVSQGNGCFPALNRGPCPQDHVVALDAQAASRGRVEVICSDLRGGCPPLQRRMVFDGKCHNNRFLKIAAPGYVIHDIFGGNVIYREGFMGSYDPGSSRPNVCNLYAWGVGSGAPDVQYPKPPCGADNDAYCSLYVVEAEPPMPD